MDVEVTDWRPLRFDDGSPVRAASAIAPFGAGWLIAQDDATHGAWATAGSTSRLRLFPPVDGHDVFSSAAGTKALKPDLEVACEVAVGSATGVLLMGSGSAPARMRAALAWLDGVDARVLTADLAPLYRSIQAALDIAADELNIEGACRDGERLTLFQRGTGRPGVPSGSVDVDLAVLLAAIVGQRPAGQVPVGGSLRYDLGEAEGVAFTITDAVSLPDGRVLVSAAAEDTANAVDDGPVVAAAVALLDQGRMADLALLPPIGGTCPKVEGLAVRAADRDAVSLVAVVDADDPDTPSAILDVVVRWG